MKVLIVEEDRRFAEQAITYLESRAHLVVHQHNVVEALARATHWGPELVILSADAALSGLLNDLLDQDERPAIILTGMLDEYHKVWKAWQSGGDDVLIKPMMNSEELHVAVVTALENAVTGERLFAPAAKASA